MKRSRVVGPNGAEADEVGDDDDEVEVNDAFSGEISGAVAMADKVESSNNPANARMSTGRRRTERIGRNQQEPG